MLYQIQAQNCTNSYEDKKANGLNKVEMKYLKGLSGSKALAKNLEVQMNI